MRWHGPSSTVMLAVHQQRVSRSRLTVRRWFGTPGQSAMSSDEGAGVQDDYYAGRVAVITGAAAGIGRALAEQLADRGARLVLWDIDDAGLAATGEECRRRGAEVRLDVVDVADRASVQDAGLAVQQAIGRVDLVFTMAGVIHTGTVLASDPEDLYHVVQVNLLGTMHTVVALLPCVLASDRGHVVTTSSAFGLIASPRYSAYSASKFAVRGFTAALRQELLMDGRRTRVSCVVPGGVRTGIVRNGRFADDVDAGAVSEGFDRRIARSTAEHAASVILRRVPRGSPQILIGGDAKLLAIAARAGGEAYQRLLPRLMRRTTQGPAKPTTTAGRAR